VHLETSNNTRTIEKRKLIVSRINRQGVLTIIVIKRAPHFKYREFFWYVKKKSPGLKVPMLIVIIVTHRGQALLDVKLV